MFKAPDTNPEVTPQPPIQASGVWASLGAIIGLLIDILPVIGPLVPEGWGPYLVALGSVLGHILNKIIHTSYKPVKE